MLAIRIHLYPYHLKYWMFEILVFWIIAGTIQGVLTPDIAKGFPSLDYLRYCIVHLGLLIVVFYSVLVMGFGQNLKVFLNLFYPYKFILLLSL